MRNAKIVQITPKINLRNNQPSKSDRNPQMWQMKEYTQSWKTLLAQCQVYIMATSTNGQERKDEDEGVGCLRGGLDDVRVDGSHSIDGMASHNAQVRHVDALLR